MIIIEVFNIFKKEQRATQLFYGGNIMLRKIITILKKIFEKNEKSSYEIMMYGNKRTISTEEMRSIQIGENIIRIGDKLSLDASGWVFIVNAQPLEQISSIYDDMPMFMHGGDRCYAKKFVEVKVLGIVNKESNAILVEYPYRGQKRNECPGGTWFVIWVTQNENGKMKMCP